MTLSVSSIIVSLIVSFEDDARLIADAGKAATVSDALSTSVVDDGCAGSAFGLGAVEGDDGGGRGVSLVCDALGLASLVSICCCCCCSCLRGGIIGFTGTGSLVRSCGFLGCGRA